MQKNVGKTLEIIASVSVIIGTCIAVIALIPAFGQWLNPREPVPPSSSDSPNTVEASPTAFILLPTQPSETAQIPNTPTSTILPIVTVTVQPTIMQAPTVFALPPLKLDINAPIQASQGDFIMADVLVSPTGNSDWVTLNGGSSGWGNIVYFEDNTTWVKPILGASTGVYNGNYETAKLASSLMFQSGCGLPDGCLHVYIRRVSQGKVIFEETVQRP